MKPSLKLLPESVPLLKRHPADREILALALPAFGALVAEPLFLLADSAMVGHLGQVPLAGLGLASAILQTLVGLMVFLAYGTTPAVARRLGQGDLRGALAVGVDGMWFALALGLLLAVLGLASSPALVAAFGPEAAVRGAALVYLRWSMAGIPAMLLVFAASGLLRGLQDTRTPLFVAGAGFAVNIALNYLLIYAAGLGLAGAAIGTVLAQWGMVAAYLWVLASKLRAHAVRLRPRRSGLLSGMAAGGWLFLRTLTLRAAMLLAVYAATALGSAQLAAFQIAMTLLATLAFALDALAIAAQALTGHRLGRGERAQARAILHRCLYWGSVCGLLLGLAIVASSGLLGRLFTSDPTVYGLLPPTLILLGLSVPLGAWVWVLDGVLIGAGDLRYLAWVGFANLGVFVPLVLLVIVRQPSGAAGLAWLIASFVFGFFGARLITLAVRARGDRWMRVGAH